MGTRGVTLWIFRVLSTLLAFGLAAQPVLAGAFLSGNYSALQSHGIVGGLLFVPAFFLMIAAVLLWRQGRISAWPVPITVAVLFAISLQLGFGYSRNLAVHLPLGVGLVVCAVLLAVWAWRTPAAVERPL